ncbi:unnamed protein product [Blumeria hordei]|uniref:Uncharacterized protein n=1 Tax=Blumeria hordei TaxID=2867405 RepID=A0A383UR33_BLUHO|nr:unnamed protein product [Blumeria hordei]
MHDHSKFLMLCRVSIDQLVELIQSNSTLSTQGGKSSTCGLQDNVVSLQKLFRLLLVFAS